MNENEKKIVEINGIKMEVDLRYAKRIDEYHVGDKVKVLVAEYGNDYKSYAGVIVGFDEFEKLPTIIVAYLKVDYSTAVVNYAYINDSENGKKVEIVHMNNEHEILFDKADVICKMDNEIYKKEEELAELKRKKNYFLQHFNKHFEKV